MYSNLQIQSIKLNLFKFTNSKYKINLFKLINSKYKIAFIQTYKFKV